VPTRRKLFVISTGLVVVGVLLHFPDFIGARHDGFMMAGMPLTRKMGTGMALILVGTVLALWSVIPPRQVLVSRAASGAATARFGVIDGAPMTRAHVRLMLILVVGLVIDTMKPASLGFAVPGMSDEYGISRYHAAFFPFLAITGTVVGSLVWGYLADLIGRRATLMFSGVMYVATSICGFMPAFNWNLLMCFLMGVAAGGMLPTVYALTAESIPARRRGPMVVLQSGLGATFGYLVASGAAAVLVPHLGWRVLWLLNLPTGVLLLVLCRWVPESPRYLLALGRVEEAEHVMAAYGMTAVPQPAEPIVPVPAIPEPVEPVPVSASTGRPTRARSLLGTRYRRRTTSVVLYGLGWGIVNWGFIIFLPTLLRTGSDSGTVDSILFFSSLFAVPNTLVVAFLYGWWSSRGSMVLYAAITVAILLGFSVLDPSRRGVSGVLFALLALLLASTGGMIAMLSPYSTELYPTSLRATGSGVAAAASKVGGMLGPLVLTSAPELGTAAAVTAVPVVLAVGALLFAGIETARRPLLEGEAA